MWLKKDQGERVELRKQEEEQTARESGESRLPSQKMGENQETVVSWHRLHVHLLNKQSH